MAKPRLWRNDQMINDQNQPVDCTLPNLSGVMADCQFIEPNHGSWKYGMSFFLNNLMMTRETRTVAMMP